MKAKRPWTVRGGWTVGLAVAFAALIGAGYALDRGLPRHQGRTARSWFAEYCRAAVRPGSTPRERETRMLDCQLALLSMGTNAVPFLMAEAFRFRPATAVHSNLHELFRDLPEWAGGGSFIPGPRRADLAAEMLRELRPPSPALAPLLRQRFASTNLLEHRQSVFLANALADVPDETAAWLSGILTNAAEEPWTRLLAAQSIRWLGRASSNVLPAALEYLRGRTNGPDVRIVIWLGVIGPGAASALPILEPHLDHTNSWTRAHTAVALARIAPDHGRALQVLRDMATGSGSDLANLATALASLRQGGTHGLPGMQEFLTERARREVAGWTATSLSFSACLGLEWVAPESAIAVYRDALAQQSSVAAAGRWLRLERTNPVPARFLMARAASGGTDPVSATSWLAEVDASNTEAMAFLERRAAGVGVAPQGMEADDARYALARIRWRAAQRARGVTVTSDR